MARFMLAVIVSVALLTRSVALADGIGIVPTSVQIDAARRIATVTIANNDPVVHTFQITSFSWNQVNGQDKLTPSTDLLVSPPIFTLLPNGQQVVRFALRNPAPVASELPFRILLRTAPTEAVPLTSEVQMLVTFSIPVFIASPQGGGPKLAFGYRNLAHNRVALTIENSGSAHTRVLHVKIADAHGTPVDSSAMQYVLAGSKATIDLATSRPVMGDTIGANIKLDSGPALSVVIHRDN